MEGRTVAREAEGEAGRRNGSRRERERRREAEGVNTERVRERRRS